MMPGSNNANNPNNPNAGRGGNPPNNVAGTVGRADAAAAEVAMMAMHNYSGEESLYDETRRRKVIEEQLQRDYAAAVSRGRGRRGTNVSEPTGFRGKQAPTKRTSTWLTETRTAGMLGPSNRANNRAGTLMTETTGLPYKENRPVANNHGPAGAPGGLMNPNLPMFANAKTTPDASSGNVSNNDTNNSANNSNNNNNNNNADGKMGHFRELKVEDALLYLDEVKRQFGDRPQIYNEFLHIMKQFKAMEIETSGVIDRVSKLFRGFNKLILGFNTFLPEGYKIELKDLVEKGHIVGPLPPAPAPQPPLPQQRPQQPPPQQQPPNRVVPPPQPPPPPHVPPPRQVLSAPAPVQRYVPFHYRTRKYF